MKINDLHISNWEAYLLENSLTEVLSFPALKQFQKNDWAEYDGVEYDLSNPKLNSHEMTLKFLVNETHYNSFLNVLTQNTYNNFLFESINKTYRLRFVGISKTEFFGRNFYLDIKFSNDNPFWGYTYTNPKFKTTDTNVLLDRKNISEYGIRLLNGSKQEITSKGEVKKPLEIQNSLLNGVIVAEKQLFYKEKIAKLQCNMHQKNLTDLLTGYEAFFYDLTRPNERILTYEGVDYVCVYKESKVKGILFDEYSNWIDFELQLIFV